MVLAWGSSDAIGDWAADKKDNPKPNLHELLVLGTGRLGQIVGVVFHASLRFVVMADGAAFDGAHSPDL